MRIPFICTWLAATLALAGCGIGAKIDARNEYQVSADRYKACLVENSANPRACEGWRLAMEADERKYTNFSAGIQQGGTGAISVLTQSR